MLAERCGGRGRERKKEMKEERKKGKINTAMKRV